MPNQDKRPTDPTRGEPQRPELRASSASPLWEIPGDVPAARRRARALSMREPEGAVNDAGVAGADRHADIPADAEMGAYDQAQIRPAMLERILSEPLDTPQPRHKARRDGRAARRFGSIAAVAGLLLVAALLGAYALQQQHPVSPSLVQQNDSPGVVARAPTPVSMPDPIEAPPRSESQTPVVVDPQVVLEKAPMEAAIVAAPPQPVSLKAAVKKTMALPRVIRHVVKKGDTLWDLAERYTHDPFRYPELARQSHIANPDLIYPGQTVRIELASNSHPL